MPSGFKGSQVLLTRITIEGKTTGPFLTVNVSYVDADGLVHGTTRHQLEAGMDPKIAAATKALYDATQKWVETIHYSEATPTQGARINPRGIVESIQDENDKAGDPGSQG